MNLIAVDSDWWDRIRLKKLLKKSMPAATIHVFAKEQDALAFAKENPIHAAFIDLGGVQIPGYFLAQKLLLQQRTNIVFMDYERRYFQEVFELRVSGYLQKPLRWEEILAEFQNFRYPIPDESCEP